MCHPWEEIPVWDTADDAEPEHEDGTEDVQREVAPS